MGDKHNVTFILNPKQQGKIKIRMRNHVHVY